MLPATAITLGLLAANSARTLFWVPAALGIGPALLFPLAVEGSQTLRSMGLPIPQSATLPWACALDDCSTTSLSHRPASLHKPNLPAAMARIAATIMQVKPRAKQFLQRPASLAAYDVQQIR